MIPDLRLGMMCNPKLWTTSARLKGPQSLTKFFERLSRHTCDIKGGILNHDRRVSLPQSDIRKIYLTIISDLFLTELDGLIDL